tara:strand:+ start:669 stop:1181 length:513 start_codon:yes stop_codon:yes gene_type:complete
MNSALKEKAKKIKLVATDIDGVWTDSKMYYSKDGVFMKSFSTYDGMGAYCLMKNNFIVAMITSEYENLDILKARAAKLSINEVYTNESKKINRIKYLAEKYNLKSENIAYIGDDINDYEVLQYVGLSAAPPQSPILKHLKVDFITERKSGDGSFRDLAELILDSQKIKII